MNADVKKELQLFKTICSSKDCKLITNEDITFNDFLRLDYILGTIELDYLEIYFFEKHCRKFKDKLEELESLNREYGSCIDMEVYEEWMEEFITNIKDKKAKHRIMNMYKMEKGSV